MRRLFFIVVSLAVLGLILVGWMGVMSETHAYTPGSLVYPLQSIAEKVRISIAHTSPDRANYAMEIFDRQAAALAKAQTPEKIERISLVLVETLELAKRHIAESPYSEQDELLADLTQRVRRADVVISAISASPEMANLDRLNQAIAALLQEEPPILKAMAVDSLTQAIAVPFLSSNSFTHVRINLRGAHTQLSCTSCHHEGKYANTQFKCNACHTLPESAAADAETVSSGLASLATVYPNHFAGDCIDCHDVESWQVNDFDHLQVKECDTCHNFDAPIAQETPYKSETLAEHYAGACLDCHNDTSSWQTISFTHQTGEACEDCHAAEAPLEHYTGACIDCHQDTTNWTDTAHHDGYTDCASCHQDVLPEEHYTGQCYYCHVPSGWDTVIFDHTGYDDCTSCHTPPEPHETDNCVRCHNTLSWYDVSIVHTNSANCISCHRNDVPGDHYTNNCSLCHNFDDWNEASFNHNVLTSVTCINCHASDAPDGHSTDECYRCHIPGSWEVLHYDHLNASDCVSCHTDDSPNTHYEGVCSNCHGVMSWTEGIHFDHTNYTVCADCHTSPEAHYPGTCASCHATTGWQDIIYVHDGTSDCSTCHNAPDQHYPDVCTDCHVTTSWTVSTVDHIVLPVDCTLCHTEPEDHYSGACTTCHTTTGWNDINFDHNGYDTCSSCHTAPDGHWPGQCSNCHIVTVWSEIDFDHTDYTNCKSCHVRPEDHSRGQCSKCHNTETWVIGDTAPLPKETEEPIRIPEPIVTPAPPIWLPILIPGVSGR